MLLELIEVRAGYGDAVVLDGVSLSIAEDGALAVLGRNGVGKSTLILTILGFTRLHRGRILWKGEDISRLAPIIVEELVRSLKNLQGMATILVEQHTGVALELTQDALVIERGAIAHRAKSAEFARDAATLERYVGLKVS